MTDPPDDEMRDCGDPDCGGYCPLIPRRPLTPFMALLIDGVGAGDPAAVEQLEDDVQRAMHAADRCEPDPFPVGTQVDIYEVPGGYLVARAKDQDCTCGDTFNPQCPEHGPEPRCPTCGADVEDLCIHISRLLDAIAHPNWEGLP